MGFVDKWLQECKGHFFEVGWDGQCFPGYDQKNYEYFRQEVAQGVAYRGP
jgi:hypothetical protein